MRLIDADEFEVVTVQGKSDDFVEGAQYVLEMIDNMPTIDAAPVVHARWRYNTFMWENDWHCSHCDGWAKEPTKYCSHCGAKMDGE